MTITDPLNRVTQATYDAHGNRLSLTNASGETVRWTYDALGRQIAFDYDAAGRLTAVTDARGNTTQYEYDEHGRRTTEIAPDGRRREYAYEDGNRLTKETRADGRVFQSSYETRDLLQSVSVLRRRRSTLKSLHDSGDNYLDTHRPRPARRRALGTDAAYRRCCHDLRAGLRAPRVCHPLADRGVSPHAQKRLQDRRAPTR
ncbi:hypothetical protein RM530_16545 [Algiphilus sp. W345]|uniref:RHS repeat protein n=1 Tax=Banduia mediterranea TaxID=3075609 RepID=A0ABU2WNY3_9GAMM|nr:hypothetical protein [Algiphilus sp. W345]MDT0498954.1 hypothetical protein [Algiphilus sp. W345]